MILLVYCSIMWHKNANHLDNELVCSTDDATKMFGTHWHWYLDIDHNFANGVFQSILIIKFSCADSNFFQFFRIQLIVSGQRFNWQLLGAKLWPKPMMAQSTNEYIHLKASIHWMMYINLHSVCCTWDFNTMIRPIYWQTIWHGMGVSGRQWTGVLQWWAKLSPTNIFVFNSKHCHNILA